MFFGSGQKESITGRKCAKQGHFLIKHRRQRMSTVRKLNSIHGWSTKDWVVVVKRKQIPEAILNLWRERTGKDFLRVARAIRFIEGVMWGYLYLILALALLVGFCFLTLLLSTVFITPNTLLALCQAVVSMWISIAIEIGLVLCVFGMVLSAVGRFLTNLISPKFYLFRVCLSDFIRETGVTDLKDLCGLNLAELEGIANEIMAQQVVKILQLKGELGEGETLDEGQVKREVETLKGKYFTLKQLGLIKAPLDEFYSEMGVGLSESLS